MQRCIEEYVEVCRAMYGKYVKRYRKECIEVYGGCRGVHWRGVGGVWRCTEG